MNRVFLTRRNLLTLLSKLDRKAQGGETKCSIIKRDFAHPKYPQSLREIMVTAVEDEDYYNVRFPSAVVEEDDPDKKRMMQ